MQADIERQYATPFRLIIAALLCLATPLSARALAAQASPHLIIVKMIDMPNARFAFQPSEIAAQLGDTVRFVQASSAPHDVHFEKTAKGSKLGAAMTGPYIIEPGKAYDLMVDARFTNGAYEFVCDPHESVGMRGTLTVGPPAK